MRDLTNTTKQGVCASNIVASAIDLGFESYGMSGEIENLKKEDLPCIAHVILKKSFQHFIVIYDADFVNNKVLIMDPARGEKILKLAEFKLISSSNYIYLKPRKNISLFKVDKVIKDLIKEFLKNNKIYLPFLIILTIIYFALNIMTSFHFKFLLDCAINYSSLNNILFISIMMIIIYLLKNITNLLRNVFLLKYSNLFDEYLTIKTFKQIILLPYLYYKNRTTGEVISRIKDLCKTKTFIINAFCFVIADVLCLIVFLILLYHLNIKLMSLVLILMFLLGVVNIIFKNTITKRAKKYQKKEDIVNSYLVEALSSVDVTKSMHLENTIIYKFRKKYQFFLEGVYKYSKILEFKEFFKNIINDFSIVFIFLTASILIVKKKMTLSELIVFQSILTYYLNSFKNIINLYNQYYEYKITKEKVEDLFMIKEEKFNGIKHYLNYDLKGTIVYKNLTFSYNGKKLLNKLNLEIKKGEKIFLTGPTGSGKSTLVKFLTRYIEIGYGNISIKDIDINHYHLEILRNKITYVSPVSYLFTDTILENITLSKNIDKNILKKVISITKLDEVINKSILGINEIVEENGFNFSSGERQRIVLARSILKDSDIYIFDEALSQIDITTEETILEEVFKYLKNKTIIFISHRFSNQKMFDRIIKIDKGKIYEDLSEKSVVN